MAAEQPIGTHENPGHEPELNRYFQAAIKTGASDLHLKVGQGPKLRIGGQIKNTTGEALTNETLERMVYEILTSEQKEFFLKNGTVDFAYEIGTENRFRINIFRQRGMISVSARRVNTEIPVFANLHLPAALEKICDSMHGLVIVSGPTGCGKTTTIASMIDYINSTRSCHIVTIEDPIEYLFQDKKAIVSQREIGIDVSDFDQALKYLMRQDPDVVLIGEMRDSKTVAAGMRAAETGHLVLGTMHSSNTSQAVQRIMDLYPQDERYLVKQTLSLALNAMISQILLPCMEEGISMVPAVEILLANPTARKLISEGRESELESLIRSAREEGMIDLTDSLCELVQNGFVDPKEAYKYAPNAEELKMALKGVRSSTGGIL